MRGVHDACQVRTVRRTALKEAARVPMAISEVRSFRMVKGR